MTHDASPLPRIDDLTAARAHARCASALQGDAAVEKGTVGVSPLSRTIVHVFEPVRDEHEHIVDFRLHIAPLCGFEATRGFAGIRMVEVGPSVAPGEALWMLKRVMESGEPVHAVTRHLNGELEQIFHQAAVRHGDSVVTTTTIVTRCIGEPEVRAA